MRKFYRILIAILCGGVCTALTLGAVTLLRRFALGTLLTQPEWLPLVIATGVGLTVATLAFILSRKLVNQLDNTEKRLSKVSPRELGAVMMGLIVGLLLAFLVSQLLNGFPEPLRFMLSACLYIISGSVCARFAYKKRRDFAAFFQNGRKEKEEHFLPERHGKLLDTSAIIDGRVLDVLKTGFLEGPLIVPQFVLGELQHISDSPEDVRRTRGRRGLDIVAAIQKETDCPLTVSAEDPIHCTDVDAKLLFLAKKYGYSVITNDFNLNKLARVQNIPVLNINDLANAVKPAVVVGEPLEVKVVREGKEPGQGVAYLEDGTMIVLENGGDAVGTTVTAVVTSALQTSAGRMIFARLEHGTRR